MWLCLWRPLRLAGKFWWDPDGSATKGHWILYWAVKPLLGSRTWSSDIWASCKSQSAHRGNSQGNSTCKIVCFLSLLKTCVTLVAARFISTNTTQFASIYILLSFCKLGCTSHDCHAWMHPAGRSDSSCWFLDTAQALPHNQDWSEEWTAGSLPELL